MDLRRIGRKMLSSRVLLAVALVAGLSEAPAQSTKKTTTAPPPKPAGTTAKPPPKTNPPGPKTNPPGPKTNPPGPERPKTNGPITYQPRPTDKVTPVPGGGNVYSDSASGRKVTTDASGQVRRIEAPAGLAGGKITINKGPHGGREIVTTRPGGVRVVGYGGNRGFVERPLPGRPGYISRTYVVGGRSYAHVYRQYLYRGVAYYRYVPAVYYGPRFYAWAVNPWAAPVPYAWFGLATPAPWFGFYAGYFAPYPFYASPDLWLTDYMLAENLRLAYESQQAANPDQAPLPPPNVQPTAAALSPEMKAAIADEVRQQLAAEKADAMQPTSSGPQRPASGNDQQPQELNQTLNQKFFVASSNLDLTVAGQACPLTPGDVIERTSKVVKQDGTVPVEVVSSKPGDCAKESEAAVQLADLQEMHNQFREQLDSGLKMLAENQAKGLPNGPPAGAQPVAEGTSDQATDAVAQLQAQQTAASNLEAQVRQGG